MADEDIFMDYAESSSPIESNTQIKFNIPRANQLRTVQELSEEKNVMFSDLFDNSSSVPDRFKVLKLREFNRRLSNDLIEKRRKLTELKEVVDQLNSKLLCQKFEKQHLLDEIKACLSSKNIFESIELEPKCSSDYSTAADEHEIMIRRLHTELAKRQELQGTVVSILQRKQQTETELESKKRKIDDLRNHLQNLLKNSKPLVDVCGYDLEALHKNKIIVDHETAVEDDAEDEDRNRSLTAVYEKLVTFVADRTDYKLRFFDVESEDDEDEDVVVVGRNPSIKSAYIQINLQLIFESFNLEPLDIFLTTTTNNILLLTVQHELVSETGLANWLKSLGTIEFLDQQVDQINWLAPLKLQPDSLVFVQESEAYEQVFLALKDAVLLRNQLQNLINQAQSNFPSLQLEFDKNYPNNLLIVVAVMNTATFHFTAQITMNSIIWTCTEDTELISSLNSIGSKYRSVLDCLQAQLELLSKQQ